MPSTMNIQDKKKRILNFIREVKDEKTLSQIESIIDESIHSLPPQRKPLTKEELIAGVDQAEKDIQEGKFYSTEQAKARLGL